MLAEEIARQSRLKAALASDPESARWVEAAHLIKCYKQLQFFDTLALYFNLRHADERGEEIYVHVPMTAEMDTSIRLNRIAGDRYSTSMDGNQRHLAERRLESAEHAGYCSRA